MGVMYAHMCALRAGSGCAIYVTAPSFVCVARASEAAGPGAMRLGCAYLMLDVPAPHQRHRVCCRSARCGCPRCDARYALRHWSARAVGSCPYVGCGRWWDPRRAAPLAARRAAPLAARRARHVAHRWLLHRVHCQSATGSRPARIGTQDGEQREDRVRVREGRKWEGGWRTEEWVVYPLPAHCARGV
ncbi:hypothetical protein DFH08DRAFT_420445, partial [Mycena albidolilacea]